MKKVITNIYEYFRQCDAVLWMLTLTAVAYSFLLIASMQRSGEYSYLRTQIIAVSVGLAASVFISAEQMIRHGLIFRADFQFSRLSL